MEREIKKLFSPQWKLIDEHATKAHVDHRSRVISLPTQNPTDRRQERRNLGRPLRQSQAREVQKGEGIISGQRRDGSGSGEAAGRRARESGDRYVGRYGEHPAERG